MRTVRSRSRAPLVALLVAGGFVTGCGGTAPQSGLTAWLRVGNGQYEPGELSTDPGTMEPTVDTVRSNNNSVFPGAQARSITGSVNGAAAAVLLGLAGDSGHWLVPVGVPDFETVGNLTFSASLSYSPDIPLGKRALLFRGIDADGNLGPVQSLSLTVTNTLTLGALVVQLEWDAEADLDLHLRIVSDMPGVAPIDVWNNAPLALPKKSSTDTPYTKAEIAAAGRLQFDSNAKCVIDGQRHEEVIFPAPPTGPAAVPTGTYEVRVDTFSLCGEPTARWHVAAFTNPTGTPTLIQEAYGQSTDFDTLGDHGAGSGVLAFSFTEPTQPPQQ
jgi:hypothetical protein